jgi:hypothetical protein
MNVIPKLDYQLFEARRHHESERAPIDRYLPEAGIRVANFSTS